MMPTLWRRRARLVVFALLMLLALYSGGFADLVRLGADTRGPSPATARNARARSGPMHRPDSKPLNVCIFRTRRAQEKTAKRQP